MTSAHRSSSRLAFGRYAAVIVAAIGLLAATTVSATSATTAEDNLDEPIPTTLREVFATELDKVSFDPGVYGIKIVAEFAGGHAINNLGVNDQGTTDCNPLIFTGEEGGFGFAPTEEKTITRQNEFGLCLLRDPPPSPPNPFLVFTDPALNPGSLKFARLFRDNTTEDVFLVAFEDQDDRDFDDLVVRVRLIDPVTSPLRGPDRSACSTDAVVFPFAFPGSGSTDGLNPLTTGAQVRIPLDTPWPAGSYDISAVSYDGFTGRSAREAQPEEIWLVEFRAGADVLGSTATTADIEDGVEEATWSGSIGQINLSKPADTLIVRHGATAGGGANSVRPVCITATLNEPSLNQVLTELGFADVTETDDEVFPPGDYEIEILAEFTSGHTSNALSRYVQGTEDFTQIFGGEDGGFGFAVQGTVSAFSHHEPFGLRADLGPDADDRYRFTERSRNDAGRSQTRVFRDDASPDTVYIGFEDSDNQDFQDLVVRLTRAPAARTVTVMAHGAVVSPFVEISREMVDELYDYWSTQNGGAGLNIYHPSSGDLVLSRGTATAANQVVLFDWTEPRRSILNASSACASGMDEAAGDALFAMLIEHELTDSDYLHLIGFSRGSVVVSEAAQRLLGHGFEVDQLTLIDQEPGSSLQSDAGQPHAWEGVGSVDNYYGSGTNFPSTCGVLGVQLLQGAPVDGAYDLEVPDVGHFEMEGWYTETIADRRSATGFALRRDASARQSATETGPRTPVDLVPTVVNGDFSYHDRIARDEYLAGWSGHGGGGGGERLSGSLRLSFGRDETRTHNRMYFPSDATELVYQVRKTNQDGGIRSNDRLEVLIDGRSIVQRSMRGRDSRFVTRRDLIPSDLRGGIHTLTFRLIDIEGRNVNSAALIDNVRLEP